MDVADTYYDRLGIARDASYGDIKAAWREKAKQWHPDKFRSADEKLKAHAAFVDILEAYTVLIDEQKRAHYDFTLSQKHSRYSGYQQARPADDLREAADLYDSVLRETPLEFAGITLTLVIVCPLFIFVWLGPIGVTIALYDVLRGTSELGFFGVVMLCFMLIPSLLASLVCIGAVMSLYLRIKRIAMWAALRVRGRRLVSRALVRTGT
jgi:DnaJ domain